MSGFRIAPTPLYPTRAMIEEGAKRLLRWDDESVWPDSWTPLQILAARNDAERVWRSMWLAAHNACSTDKTIQKYQDCKINED